MKLKGAGVECAATATPPLPPRPRRRGASVTSTYIKKTNRSDRIRNKANSTDCDSHNQTKRPITTIVRNMVLTAIEEMGFIVLNPATLNPTVCHLPTLHTQSSSRKALNRQFLITGNEFNLNPHHPCLLTVKPSSS